jgi:hypothetical protein
LLHQQMQQVSSAAAAAVAVVQALAQLLPHSSCRLGLLSGLQSLQPLLPGLGVSVTALCWQHSSSNRGGSSRGACRLRLQTLL